MYLDYKIYSNCPFNVYNSILILYKFFQCGFKLKKIEEINLFLKSITIVAVQLVDVCSSIWK